MEAANPIDPDVAFGFTVRFMSYSILDTKARMKAALKAPDADRSDVLRSILAPMEGMFSVFPYRCRSATDSLDEFIPATFLHNGWYTDNHRQQFESARQSGFIANSVSEGRIAAAPRRDFAEAAAVVPSTPDHEGKAYELSADAAWNYSEFAATVQESFLDLTTPPAMRAG